MCALFDEIALPHRVDIIVSEKRERAERRALQRIRCISNLNHVPHLWLTSGKVRELTEQPGRDATLPLTLHFRGVSALPLLWRFLRKTIIIH